MLILLLVLILNIKSLQENGNADFGAGILYRDGRATTDARIDVNAGNLFIVPPSRPIPFPLKG